MSELVNTSEVVIPAVPNKNGKINLLDLNRQQMREFFKEMGEKPFRADQVMKWMYHYCSDNFDDMTDINKVLRNKLKEVAEIRAPEVVEEQRSSDGTIKWAIAVGDQRVETVYIPEDDRATLCVSSQVGCALECKFCSTAQQGFNRNLRVSEIIGQVWRAAKIVALGLALHLLALLGGWPAAWLAQQNMRHKSSKTAFRAIYWATIACLNVGVGGFIACLAGRKINDRFTNDVGHLVNAIVETVLDKGLINLSGNGSGNLNARLSHDESLS